MTKRLATFSSRLAIYLMTMLALVACGGGGGGGDGGFIGDGGSNTDTYFLSLTLQDPGGNSTNRVTTAAPGTLVVKVTKNKASGGAIEGAIVSASADVDVLINGANGETTQISSADGTATFRIEAGATKGAGKLTVSVEDQNGVQVVKTLNIQVGATGFRLGYFDNGAFIEAQIQISPEGTLSSEGQAALSLAIVDENGDLVESAEKVNFSSNCLSAGDAAISPANPVDTATGLVSVTYAPSGCSGADSITASLVGSSATAYGTIEVAPPSANGLTFMSADPALIVLKGTGGGPNRTEKSRVTFKAVDGNNQPQEGVAVHFELTTDVGGLSLTPTTGVSNADGEVSTVVSSGDVATVVRVIATADSGDGTTEVSAVSDVLTVSTGLPDQNSISLSVATSFVVPEGMTRDGVTRELTVRMADKFNNPVPDGTAALFTTEYGSIEPSCETVDGACSVTWTSQAPRFPTLGSNQELVRTIYDAGYSCPSHNGSSGPCPDDLGYIRGGRSTVLVTAIGEESFIDRNGNGIFDQAEADDELFANLTEAFLDNNENGLFDPATTTCINSPNSLVCKAGSEEIFSDFNVNGSFDANGDDPANGYPDEGVTAVYNGLLCPEEGDGVWCSRELVNVFDTAVLILSADPNWDIALYRGRTPVASTSAGNIYTAYIADIFNNMPPAGSTVDVGASGDCTIDGLSGTEVPNTTRYGAFAVSFTQNGEGGEGGEITITLTPQGGGPAYSESWPCTTPLPPDPNDLGVSP